MDGFDDPYHPSQESLEKNPFADPFAQRSASPDPWRSYGAQPTPEDPYQPYQGYQVVQSSTPPLESTSRTDDAAGGSGWHRQETGDSSLGKEAFLAEADPLDSAAANKEDPVESTTTPRTPGFKESIGDDPEPVVLPAGYSQTETIRNLEPEEIAQPSESRAYTSPSPARQPISYQRAPSPPALRPSTSTFTPPPSASKPHAHSVPSPLEQTPNKIENSFASLALGGESSGGWQGSQGGWANDAHFASPSVGRDDGTDGRRSVDSAPPVSEDVLSSPKGAPATLADAKRDKAGMPPLFVITVDDPQKVGDPIRPFIMYTVHTRTTSPLFAKSAFSVLRRYSDFLWLYETLSINNPGVVVPPVPDKNAFGRFQDTFVQQRRQALEKCIQKAANHPVLCKDPDLRLFLESDTFALDIKHRKAELANERGGLLASIGQAVAGPRFYETDEWFDRQKAYLDSLETQLRGLVKAIETVSTQRQELAISIGEYAQTISDLGSSDVGKTLQGNLTALAEAQRKAQDIQIEQGKGDLMTLMSTVDEYARLINSVRMAFSSRVRTYHTWKTADAEVKRVQQAHEKNRQQGRLPADRSGHSLSLIADAERRALEAKHDFDHASRLIKTEIARFEQERIEDFRDSLQAFLDGMISRQKEVIAAWEQYQQQLLKRVGLNGLDQSRPPPQASSTTGSE